MIRDKPEKIVDLQDSIELDKLDHKNYNFNKISLPALFLRDIYRNNLSIERADNEQSDLFKMFGNLNKGRKSSEKISFFKRREARDDVLNSFKSNLFPTKI